MPNKILSSRNSPSAIVVYDRNLEREDEKILATVPSRTSDGRYIDHAPNPEMYRQALKSMLATPDIENRLAYITASLIVTVFGGWMASRMIASRAFSFFVDLMLFITALAMAGLLIGILVGKNILPAETILVLLFMATGVLLLIVGFVLRSLIIAATARPQKQRNEPAHRKGTI